MTVEIPSHAESSHGTLSTTSSTSTITPAATSTSVRPKASGTTLVSLKRAKSPSTNTVM
jgi:hypothetical protein